MGAMQKAVDTTRENTRRQLESDILKFLVYSVVDPLRVLATIFTGATDFCQRPETQRQHFLETATSTNPSWYCQRNKSPASYYLLWAVPLYLISTHKKVIFILSDKQKSFLLIIFFKMFRCISSDKKVILSDILFFRYVVSVIKSLWNINRQNWANRSL